MKKYMLLNFAILMSISTQLSAQLKNVEGGQVHIPYQVSDKDEVLEGVYEFYGWEINRQTGKETSVKVYGITFDTQLFEEAKNTSVDSVDLSIVGPQLDQTRKESMLYDYQIVMEAKKDALNEEIVDIKKEIKQLPVQHKEKLKELNADLKKAKHSKPRFLGKLGARFSEEGRDDIKERKDEIQRAKEAIEQENKSFKESNENLQDDLKKAKKIASDFESKMFKIKKLLKKRLEERSQTGCIVVYGFIAYKKGTQTVVKQSSGTSKKTSSTKKPSTNKKTKPKTKARG